MLVRTTPTEIKFDSIRKKEKEELFYCITHYATERQYDYFIERFIFTFIMIAIDNPTTLIAPNFFGSSLSFSILNHLILLNIYCLRVYFYY